jgi:hypothetical protein
VLPRGPGPGMVRLGGVDLGGMGGENKRWRAPHPNVSQRGYEVPYAPPGKKPTEEE